MRVIDTHGLAYDLGALGVLLVVRQAHLVHRVEHTAMHRLQSIAHVGQRAPNDDRHRIGEIRTAHLVFNVDRLDISGARSGGTAAVWIQRKLGVLIVSHACVSLTTQTLYAYALQT